MEAEQQERYSRHMLLAGFGAAGQERLRAARVLVVGLGGLGSPAAMYLASSGVGTLTLVDFDHVQLSNLQRQIIHGTPDLGHHKVDSARERIHALNPEVEVDTVPELLEDEELAEQVRRADVVVDGSDNFATRFTLNAASVRTGTPLVSGAALRTVGQVSVFQPRLAASPCYRCLYTDEPEEGETCAQVGVLAPLLGIIGSIQATEVLKLITGMGTTLTGRVLVIDALTMEWRTLRLRKDPACPLCGARPPAAKPIGA